MPTKAQMASTINNLERDLTAAKHTIALLADIKDMLGVEYADEAVTEIQRRLESRVELERRNSALVRQVDEIARAMLMDAAEAVTLRVKAAREVARLRGQIAAQADRAPF